MTPRGTSFAARWRAWWPTAAWAVLILVLTSVPQPEALPLGQVFGLDKLAHVTLYAVLGVLATLGAARDPGLGRRPASLLLLGITGCVALHATVGELGQAWIPGRSAELLDWVADLTGGALGSLGVLLWLRRPFPRRAGRAG